MTRAVDPKSVRAGTFQGGAPDTDRVGDFYAKKRKLEAQLGREISIDEFRATMAARRATPGGHSGSPLSAYKTNRQTEPGLTWVGGNREWDELDETSRKNLAASSSGTSIFDPVLTELCYKWFCPAGGLILDPFAGGSVRGIVASVLGYRYAGFELRAEQVAANLEQAARITPEQAPEWIVGDSRETIPAYAGGADFVFSCPPYGDLEVYSDEAADLSNMGHEAFIDAYRAVISVAVGKLKPDRFAAFVVGDFRDKKGFYRNFVGETVSAFETAGARLYNEAILITSVGSLPVRVARQFTAARKLGKTHQNVLVFCNGDPKRASTTINEAVP